MIGAFAIAFMAGGLACFLLLLALAGRRARRDQIVRRLGGQNSTEPIIETGLAIRHGPNGKERFHAL